MDGSKVGHTWLNGTSDTVTSVGDTLLCLVKRGLLRFRSQLLLSLIGEIFASVTKLVLAMMYSMEVVRSSVNKDV
jgi:hypothetical protein